MKYLVAWGLGIPVALIVIRFLMSHHWTTRDRATKEHMNLRHLDRFTPFAAGLAIGVTATPLLVPEAGGNTQNHIRNAARRIGDRLKARAREPGPGAVGVPGEKRTAGIETAEGEKV